MTAQTISLFIRAQLSMLRVKVIPSEQGPGAGASQSISNTSYAGCGASHGGWGSNAYNNLDNTNPPYGSIKNPVEYGSGGGRNTAYSSYGGSGGGIIDLNVGGTLTVNGYIDSLGNNGQNIRRRRVRRKYTARQRYTHRKWTRTNKRRKPLFQFLQWWRRIGRTYSHLHKYKQHYD